MIELLPMLKIIPIFVSSYQKVESDDDNSILSENVDISQCSTKDSDILIENGRIRFYSVFSITANTFSIHF